MKKCTIAVVMAAVMMMVFSGCASTSSNNTMQGGASQEKYFLGTYSAVFSTDIIKLDKAVRETCAKARLREVGRKNTANSCDYQFKDVNNIPLRITLQENKDNTVKITLKVGGVSGWDKEACQVLLIDIDNRLRSLGDLN